MYAGGLSHISAGAWVPEQLVHYVAAVSGRRACLCGDYAAYTMDGHATLVAYPWAADATVISGATGLSDASGLSGASDALEALAQAEAPRLAEALESLAAMGCARVTVLAPFALPASLPGAVPGAIVSARDSYWQIALPGTRPGQKLRNLLKRAAQEVTVRQEAFGTGHQALVARYLAERDLPPGTRAIFSALPAYAGLAGQAGVNLGLYSARRSDGSLAGFAVGDFSGLHSAFYMFAFRARNAPPGTADLLLKHILLRAKVMGHRRLNLGLGVNPGIAFFKQKWGATPLLPYVESQWTRQSPSSFLGGLRRLFRGTFL